MKKEIETSIQERIELLREHGVKPPHLAMIKTSIRLQQQFLPLESIVKWLDDEILKSGRIVPAEKKQGRK